MTPIRAVLFDYGLVLSGPPERVAWQSMEGLLHADAERFHAAYWQFRDAYDRGSLSGPHYWRAVAADLGRSLQEADLTTLLDLDTTVWSQPNEWMVDWVARLQRSGMKTGILSNLGDSMEAGIRARLPWLSNFTHCTFSHRLGIAKPDAATYRSAAEGLQVQLSEILFIDDREVNTAAAKAAGMAAIQYVNHATFLAAMHSEGFGYLL